MAIVEELTWRRGAEEIHAAREDEEGQEREVHGERWQHHGTTARPPGPGRPGRPEQSLQPHVISKSSSEKNMHK